MKNRKGLFLLGALVVVLVLVLAGCGSTASNADNSKPADTAAPADNAAAPADNAATAAQTAAPAKGLVEQVKETGHYNYFPLRVAAGPEADAAAHYGDSCIECHSAVKRLDDENAKLADFFPGGKYAGQDEGITCRVCHEFKGKDMVELRATGWDTCGQCHTSEGAPKLGSAVHHPQMEFVKGVGVGDVPDMPSVKYNMTDFSCQDCHVTNSSKHDFQPYGVTTTHDGVNRTSESIDYSVFVKTFDQDKCKTCHANPQVTVDMVKQQQDEIKAKLATLDKTYADLQEKLKDTDKNDPKVQAMNNGNTYLSYVEGDASYGVHNIKFAKALLDAAEKSFQQAQ